MDSDNVSAKYGAYEIPYTVIVDKNGNLTYKNSGVASYETLRSEIDIAISGEGNVVKVAKLPTPALAVILGIVTFFSPCSFPLLPGYFSYYFSRREEVGGSKLIKAGCVVPVLNNIFPVASILIPPPPASEIPS